MARTRPPPSLSRVSALLSLLCVAAWAVGALGGAPQDANAAEPPAAAAPGAWEMGEAAVEAGWQYLELVKLHVVGDGYWYLHPDVARVLGWHSDADAPDRVYLTRGAATPHLTWAIRHYGLDMVVDPDDVLLFVDNSAWVYWHEIALVTATHVTHVSHVCNYHQWGVALADVRDVLPRHDDYQCRRLDAPFGVPAHRHFCGGSPRRNPPGAGNATWSPMPVMCSPSVDAVAALLHAYLPRIRGSVARQLHAQAASVAAMLSDADAAASVGQCDRAAEVLGEVWAGRLGDARDDDVGAATGAGSAVLNGSHPTTAAFAYPVAPSPMNQAWGGGDSDPSIPVDEYAAAEMLGDPPSVLEPRNRPTRLAARRARALWHAMRATSSGCRGADVALDAAVGGCADVWGLLGAARGATSSHGAGADPLADYIAHAGLMATGAASGTDEAMLAKWFKLFRTTPKRCKDRALAARFGELLREYASAAATSGADERASDAAADSGNDVGAPAAEGHHCGSAQARMRQAALAAGYELLLASGCTVVEPPAYTSPEPPQLPGNPAATPDEPSSGDSASGESAGTPDSEEQAVSSDGATSPKPPSASAPRRRRRPRSAEEDADEFEGGDVGTGDAADTREGTPESTRTTDLDGEL